MVGWNGRAGAGARAIGSRGSWPSVWMVAGACGLALGGPACGGGADGDTTFGGVTATDGQPGDGTSGSGPDSGPRPDDDDDDASTTSPPGDGTTSGDAPTSDGSDDGGSTTGAPPYECEVEAATSPNIAGEFIFSPAQPHPGDTLTVIVRSTNGTSRADAPPMDLHVDAGDGAAMLPTQTIEGGDALYYYAVPDLALGDVCLRGMIGGALETTAKITVTPRPPGPPIDPGGVYRITTNHQWTCDEQPGNGNELHVWVRDEAGQPMEGARVRVALADSVDPETIHNGDVELPGDLVTGADGHAQTFNYWPISEHGLLVLEVSMADWASDVATEITTGWWEDDLMGCSYCGTPTINVWGHWSYTVEFQRDPGATEVCERGTDHAGMTACGEPRHIHHDPLADACHVP